MKAFFAGFLLALVAFVLLFVWLHRVGKSPRHAATAPDALHEEWLATSAALAQNPAPGSDEERVLIDKVKAAFHPFSVENVTANFPKAYAESFYFRDAFHLFTERGPMVDYMIKTAALSPGVTFEYGAVARNGIDHYLPWVMVLPSRSGGSPQRSLGVSRLRFNAEGQVIFHQDYWDSADVLVPRVPIANGLIELVRRRF
jgi:hypothetical protein